MPRAPFTPREMIGRLVGFDTTSRESNLDLIEFVADYLDQQGIAASLTYDDERRKANLFATIGPADDGGVILSGHTDVVPVDGQPWSSDPFDVVERDGRLYGRGTADMKSFLAISLALVPEFKAHPLAVPIHLAFSYDEEVGCRGVGRLIDGMRESGIRPAVAIVGEPTGMRLVNGHKGIHGFRTTVTGREAHSSTTHLGVNAVMAAAELIHHLAETAEAMKLRAEPESGFEPPYTTIQVGMIEGGTAANIIPRHCRFVWEYRLMPGSDPDEIITDFKARSAELEAAMKSVAPEAAIVTAGGSVPGLRTEPDSPAERLVRELTGNDRADRAAFVSEGGLFQNAGLSVVVCGPGHVTEAHKPDEFIALDQVAEGTAFLRRLGERLCRPL
ncbi:MAG TPA: acetylornithine deacetylase [Deltaproteobacteria bacterium]|nr:acetylornithine deacetylase [Deltaproteobacteria bacterium]